MHCLIIEFIEYCSSYSLCCQWWRCGGPGEQLSLRLMHRSSGRWVAYCLNAILSGRPRQPCVMPLTLVPANPSPAASVPRDGPPAGSTTAGSGSGDLVSFIYVYLAMCHPWRLCCCLLTHLLSLEQQSQQGECQPPLVVAEMAAGLRAQLDLLTSTPPHGRLVPPRHAPVTPD